MDSEHTKQFKIALLNVRSLVIKFATFKETISKISWDIIILTETWCNNNITNEIISLDGYQLFRKDRNLNIRGGGIVVYIKNKYRCNVINLDEAANTELLWISLNIRGLHTILGAAYRPPKFPYLEFLSTLEQCLSNVVPKYDQVLIGGDFNIDFLDANGNAYKKLFNILDSYSLNQVVSSPTRIGPTSSTLLDIFICSDNINVDTCDVVDVPHISDHCLVSVFFNDKTNIQSEPMMYTYRDFRKFDHDKFIIDLGKCDFNQIIYCTNIEAKLNLFNTLILELFDTHAPIITARLIKKKHLGSQKI